MTFRNLSDIFPDFYLGVRDEELLRRMVDAHLEECFGVEDLYNWIERLPDPYLREACTVITDARIRERTKDEDDDFRMNVQLYEEQVLPNLKRIMRYAQTDQIAEEMLYEEGARSVTQTCPQVEKQSRLDRLEEQVSYLTHEMQKMRNAPTKSTCPYIIPNDYKSADEIDNELRQAAIKDAPTLSNYLMRAAKIGYLNFGQDSKKTIFATLAALYPISYQYDNFKRYFRL